MLRNLVVRAAAVAVLVATALGGAAAAHQNDGSHWGAGSVSTDGSVWD